MSFPFRKSLSCLHFSLKSEPSLDVKVHFSVLSYITFHKNKFSLFYNSPHWFLKACFLWNQHFHFANSHKVTENSSLYSSFRKKSIWCPGSLRANDRRPFKALPWRFESNLLVHRPTVWKNSCWNPQKEVCPF